MARFWSSGFASSSRKHKGDINIGNVASDSPAGVGPDLNFLRVMNRSNPHAPKIPLALALLVVAWLGLAVRMALALVRHESLAGDLALPAFAFFVCSALLAGQVYSRLSRQPASSG